MRGFGFGHARQARRRRGVTVPTLGALSLAASGVTENSAPGTTIGGVLGTTAGSTLSLVGNAGGRFALSGGNLVTGSTPTDFETATTHSITIRETLTGIGNSPRDTVLTVTVSNVFEQPTLVALSLSATTFTVGTAASGGITGPAAAGSTIMATGLPSGLTIDGAGRTWAWSGVGSAAASTITLTETLADSANSPRASNVNVTVSAHSDLPNFRSALAAAQAGTAGPLVINVIGDSTVVGAGGGTGSPATTLTNNARGGAINQKLADAFVASAGLSKNGADIFGFGFTLNTGTPADYAGFNTSVTPGGWSYVNNLKSVGGNMWNIQASGADFVWTAEARPFDQLVVYYVKASGLGTFKVLIDGVDQGNVVGNGSTAFGRIAFPVTLGTHSIALRWVSGSCYMVGMETMDTTAKASVRVRNLGQGSATSSDIVSANNAWDALNAIAGIDAAHLHIIEGGVINDWLNSLATSTTSANLTTLMAAAQTKGGDVLLLGPTRSNTATRPSAAVQQSYVDAVAALANGTTRAFYDLKAGVGDYATMSAASRMYDDLHPNLAGYTAEAAAVYGAIGA